MFTKRKAFFTSLIALCMAVISLAYFVLPNYAVPAMVRTVELSQNAIDDQAILNEFENAVIENEGSLTSFTGYKAIDATMFEEFDNISADDIDNFVGCRVKYDFSYDSKTNIVTISAEMRNELGEIYIDNVQGVCFYNEKGDIDAVLNIDGEGILLSEMRDAGMIQNCGWFASLVKKVAAATAVVAVTVAVAAVIVATAGTATPAVVGVGVAVATATTATTSTALAIASTSLTVAAIAAGVAITAQMVDNIEWQGVRYKMQELTDAVRYAIRNSNYYLALATTDGKMFVSVISVTDFVAATASRAGISIYTYDINSALSLTHTVNYSEYPQHHVAHNIGLGYFNHYHVYKSNQTSHIFYGAPRLW